MAGFQKGFSENSEATNIFDIISLIFQLAVLIPSITVATRRLHDTNRSGWWQLIVLTIIGIIPLLFWLCKKGTEDKNKFD
jgi:uncharacterized membrane protein YhaH (DUF805 family)